MRCPSRGVIYNDRLCAFRALACHNSGDSPKLEKTTKMYYAQWITKHTKKGSFSDFPAFAKKFECSHCSKIFNRRDNLHRHESTCTKSRYIYPGGFHSLHETVFEELEDFGLHVASEHRSYPYFVLDRTKRHLILKVYYKSRI